MGNSQSAWEAYHADTKAYIVKHGHTADETSELGKWALRQREALLNLTIEREKLEVIQREIPQILFEGSPEMLNEMLWLEKIFEMADHVLLHHKMPYQPTPFGRWALYEFRIYNTGEMSKKRMARFAAELPLLLETKEAKAHNTWLKNLNKLVVTVRRNGDLPKGSTSEVTWMRKQIKSLKLGQMDDQKLATIEELCPILLVKAGKAPRP